MFLRIVGPFQIDSTPCKSTSKGRKNQVITLFQPTLPIPQTKRKCTGSCITILLYVYHNFFRRKPHTRCCCINDTKICLVRYQPIYIITCQVIFLHDLCRNFCHICNSKFKYLLPFLLRSEEHTSELQSRENL